MGLQVFINPAQNQPLLVLHFLSHLITDCSDLHLAPRSGTAILSLTFGLGNSTELAGAGQAQRRTNLCLDRTKFCHCLHHSTVIDAGSGWAAEGPSCNTTHYSTAKKTQSGRNIPEDHVEPFSFIKHRGERRGKKITLEVLLDPFCFSAFLSS